MTLIFCKCSKTGIYHPKLVMVGEFIDGDCLQHLNFPENPTSSHFDNLKKEELKHLLNMMSMEHNAKMTKQTLQKLVNENWRLMRVRIERERTRGAVRVQEQEQETQPSASSSMEQPDLTLLNSMELNMKSSSQPYVLNLGIPTLSGLVNVFFHFGNSTTGNEVIDTVTLISNGYINVENATLRLMDNKFPLYQTLVSSGCSDGSSALLIPKVRGGARFSVKGKFTKREDAVRALKKKVVEDNKADPDYDIAPAELPTSFATTLNEFEQKLQELMSFKATLSQPLIPLCLKHVSTDSLHTLQSIFAKGQKGKKLSAEEKATRAIQCIFPSLLTMDKMTEKLYFNKSATLTRLLEVFIDEYNLFNSQSGNISIDVDKFQSALEKELERRADGVRHNVNEEALSGNCHIQ